MSRKNINGKWSIRSGHKSPTPYLRKNYDLLMDKRKGSLSVADLGCGNGRNSDFMFEQGNTITSIDMANDYGDCCILGTSSIPIDDKSVDIILCNFIFMFLNKAERKQMIGQIKRIAKDGCMIMVELYNAKDSYATTDEAITGMQNEIFEAIGWDEKLYSKGRFVAQLTKGL